MNTLAVKFLRLAHADNLDLPSYATSGAAGLDLAAAIGQPICLKPNMRQAIPTGFAMALPAGYEAQIRPRSGLALKYGITVANAPGTIDSDYRGEIAVILVNNGTDDFTITHGMRIAQMVIAAVTIMTPVEADDLDDTARAAGGFGSTGL
ncbi:dUTP diphosphatase [Alphaproteobacteria bacterium]|nr:dUTP diphosphatase [Alphaproteobacteria bacterium]